MNRLWVLPSSLLRPNLSSCKSVCLLQVVALQHKTRQDDVVVELSVCGGMACLRNRIIMREMNKLFPFKCRKIFIYCNLNLKANYIIRLLRVLLLSVCLGSS